MDIKLDVKDRKILECLDSDARASLGVIAKKAILSKQVVDYRIKSLIARGIIKGFKASIDISKLGYSSYTVYVTFQNVNKVREKEIFDFIVGHAFTRWVVSCSGKWDLAFTITAKDAISFNQTLKEILGFIGPNLGDYETNTVLDLVDFGLSFFFNKYQERKVVCESAQKIEKIDEKDFIILKELHKNARIKLIELASKTGLSADAVNYRMKALKAKGLLVGFFPTVNLALLDYSWYQVLLHLRNLSEAEEKKLLKRLSSLNGIRYVVRCIGKWNFEVHVVAKSNLEFKEILVELRNIFSDYIRNYDTNIILEKHKSTTLPEGVKI